MRAEIETMLRNEKISQIDHTQGEFLSSLFLVEKKGGGQRPVTNLENLNFFVPYEHFELNSYENFKFEFTRVPPPERRLCSQAGLEGYFLLRTSQQGL